MNDNNGTHPSFIHASMGKLNLGLMPGNRIANLAYWRELPRMPVIWRKADGR